MSENLKKKITKWIWIILFSPIVILFVFILFVWLFADIPSFKDLEHPNNKLATQVIAENGEILTTFHIENRTYVSYDELSPYLIQAAVATEDVRFYNHSGIDFRSLARVGVKTVLLGRLSQGGGSTITQQLAKTLYPRDDFSRYIIGFKQIAMISIKLKEWITAVKLERDYTKEELINMYLNSIFFGSHAFGIRSASETFFAKEPNELNIQEAATLVGMVNKPTRYNPHLNPTKSLLRRNFVLGQMAKAKYITTKQRDSLRELPIKLTYKVINHNSGIAPYFRDMLRRTMNKKEPKRENYSRYDDYVADSLRWENDDFYGWMTKNKKPNGEEYNLDKDGLKIYTTINYKMQKYAEEAVAEHLGKNLQKDFWRDLRWKRNKPFSNDVSLHTRNGIMKRARRWSDRYRMGKREGLTEKAILKSFDKPTQMRIFSWNKKGYIDTLMTPNDSIRYYKSILRTGFLAIEPNTGHLKAYVGGPNYRYFKYDNIDQGRRQVGSTIKPFLYTLAMQEGMTPCTKVVNVPQTFIIGNQSWTPRSTDRKEWIGQTVTLKWGLTHSSNNISAYLMKQFGPHAMADMMRKMGISSYVDEVESLCMGPADISIKEMVAAYNTFPSKGVFISPIFVTKIEDNDGNVLAEFRTKKKEAISTVAAYRMAKLMEGVVNKGTASKIRRVYRLKGDIAGKTGTTNDHSDGWFIGYTPKITAGVWVGAEDRQVHFQSLGKGSGSNMALPIWAIFMKKVFADKSLGIKETDYFVPPYGVSPNIGDCDQQETETQISTPITEDSYFD